MLVKRAFFMVYAVIFVGLCTPYVQARNEDTDFAASEVSADERIEVKSIHVLVDGQDLSIESVDAMPRFAIMMQRISIRTADVMRFGDLRRKLYFSLLRLRQLPYFSSSSKESNVAYKVHETVSGSHEKRISVYFTLKSKKSLLFGFGNAYGVIGMYRPSGLDIVIYAGLNRQELDIQYRALPYGRSFLSAGASLYNYWLLPALSTAELSMQSLLYGADAFMRFAMHPTLEYTFAVGFTAQSTVKKKNPAVADFDVAQSGLAPVGQTTLSLDVRNSFLYSFVFSDTGVYKSKLRVKIPYIVGFANVQAENIYDVLGISVSVQGAFVTASVHHAVRVRSGFATNVIQYAARPFHAKAKVLEGFYNTTAREFSLQRRGVYPLHTSIGDMGYALSIEYLIGGVSDDNLGFSGFVFYDTGAAAHRYEDLLTNTRHTVGPGILFHFFDPLNVDCRFSLGFGGHLLGNPDGRALSFSFSAATAIR